MAQDHSCSVYFWPKPPWGQKRFCVIFINSRLRAQTQMFTNGHLQQVHEDSIERLQQSKALAGNLDKKTAEV
jgi:hypothetical protein